MRIKSMHSADGWRVVYPMPDGARIMSVAFFAVAEQDTPGDLSPRVIPLVADDHDFAKELAPAESLGAYALLGPGETAEPEWVAKLMKRHRR